MNFIEFLRRLQKLFSKYEQFLVLHPLFPNELAALLKKGGLEAKFLAVFEHYLELLATVPLVQLCNMQGFEPLKHGSELYVMRFTNQNNIRILFMPYDGKFYLLIAFAEKQGKHNTEYEYYSKPGKERFTQLISGGEEHE